VQSALDPAQPCQAAAACLVPYSLHSTRGRGSALPVPRQTELRVSLSRQLDTCKTQPAGRLAGAGACGPRRWAGRSCSRPMESSVNIARLKFKLRPGRPHLGRPWERPGPARRPGPRMSFGGGAVSRGLAGAWRAVSQGLAGAWPCSQLDGDAGEGVRTLAVSPHAARGANLGLGYCWGMELLRRGCGPRPWLLLERGANLGRVADVEPDAHEGLPESLLRGVRDRVPHVGLKANAQ
jgi:hypothetical protein